MTSITLRLGNNTLQSKDMKKLMKEEKFDLVIVGIFSEFLLGVADHFKCPSILFSSLGLVSIMGQAVGNPLGTSGTPHLLLPVKEMNFFGRLKTFLVTGVELLMTEYFKYRSKQVYDFNFPADRYRSYEESLKNVSLAILNTHFSSSVVRPYLPNVIEVGGLQLKSKPDPLPEDLKNFLDEAEDGTIIFSLGSNAKTIYLAKETLSIILRVFSMLKQRIVMKWESDTMEGKPDNVFIGKWLPQDDILPHPNLKLFISHCGLGGTVEAKYHGIPILGLPLFGDQHSNAATIVNEGWGLEVDLQTLSEESFNDAIQEILNNPKYTEIAKQKSALTRDRPLSAQDTAIFWIEYVLRHNGAPHLHYQGAKLNFWQYNSIDMILFLFALIFVVFKFLKAVCRNLFCKNSKEKPKNKKEKTK